ncbi:MAG: MFS transporter [Atopobiaceae bacterium]
MPENPSASRERACALRLAFTTFFRALGFQATYFVGIIGSATYLLGSDAMDVSLLVVLLNVTLVAAGAAAGVVVDRIGPRKTMLAFLVLLGVTGIIGVSFPMSMALLVVVNVLEGIAGGFCMTASSAYPRYLADDAATLQKINSYNNTAMCVSVIAGPLIGGWLTALFTSQMVFAVLPLSSAVSACFVWGLPELLHPEGTGKKEEGFWKQLAEGIHIVFSHPVIAALFLIYFLGYFAYGAFDSLESLFYRDVLKVGSEWMGWISAAAGIGSTVGALAVLRFSERRLSLETVALLLVVIGVGSMVYVGTSSVAVALVGQLITGFGFGAMGPVKDMVLQKNCDIRYIGRATSVLSVGMNSAGTLPLLVAPFFADAFGVQATLFGASTIAAAIGAVALAWTHAGNPKAA